MTKTEIHNLLGTFEEMRDEARTVDALPLVTALVFLHTVDRFESYFAPRGLALPEGGAQELAGLVLSTKRVYSHMKATFGDKVKGDFKVAGLANLDEAVIARTSRSVGRFISQVTAGMGEREGLQAVGQSYSHLMDYVTKQFPKSSGIMQTPETLAQLMVGLMDVQPGMKVLDFTAGLARTLVELARQQLEAGHDPNDLTYVAQEEIEETAILGAIHLAVNGVTNFTVHVKDTLLEPATKLGDFDRVIADPPIGMVIPHLLGRLEKDPRFAFGKALPKTADWAFLQHGLTALKPGGRAIFVTAHGPMFRGGTEASVRRDLLSAGWLNTVISLPSALYANTALPMVLTVFDRPDAGERGRGEVLMVDVSEMGNRVGRINVLTPEVRQNLLALFNHKKSAPTAALVENGRIQKNDDAWQPNQYLEKEVEAGPDLGKIKAELKTARERLNQAAERLDTAMSNLGRA